LTGQPIRAETRKRIGNARWRLGRPPRSWGRTKGGDPAAFIGTLVGRAQARYRDNDQESHKSLVYRGNQRLMHVNAEREAAAMRIALYQPDIPQNTGTILRFAACLGVEAHIIEPAGFPTSDRAFRRAGMDYLDRVALTRHASWAAFEAWRRELRLRLIVFTTGATTCYLDHAYRPGDILLFGRESSGLPDAVHRAADARLVIPMRPGLRSINVAMAAAMALGEAMRQTDGFRHE
jgi:tRNA (cytidine/uridine-2'-O-)-methyltransferase